MSKMPLRLYMQHGMSKMTKKKEQKQDSILKAAQELFLTEGYVQTSMDKIAAKAQVTKQTVYRYFPSKEVLFEATLKSCRERPDDSFLDQLDKPDTRDTLQGFAVEFILAHLSQEHLAIVRLMISENANAPELTKSFFMIGPSKTDKKLDEFFKERLHLNETSHPICMWTSMLLSMRTSVLMGLPAPTKTDVKEYAEKLQISSLSQYYKHKTNNQW